MKILSQKKSKKEDMKLVKQMKICCNRFFFTEKSLENHVREHPPSTEPVQDVLLRNELPSKEPVRANRPKKERWFM